MGAARRGLLLDQWRGIQEDQEVYDDHGDPSAAKHRRRRLNQGKEQWYGPRLPRGFSVAVHVRAGLPPGHQARLPRRRRCRPPRGEEVEGVLDGLYREILRDEMVFRLNQLGRWLPLPATSPFPPLIAQWSCHLSNTQESAEEMVEQGVEALRAQEPIAADVGGRAGDSTD